MGIFVLYPQHGPFITFDLRALQSAAMGITAMSCAAMLINTGGGDRNMKRPRDWITGGMKLKPCEYRGQGMEGVRGVGQTMA